MARFICFYPAKKGLIIGRVEGIMRERRVRELSYEDLETICVGGCASIR